MKLDLYQIDAFASQPFAGNPAAVCPLDVWLPDAMMQAIAAENNLSETAFLVANGQRYDLRWFTPTSEVNLCGHATLAAAYVLYEILGFDGDRIEFNTKSGMLRVVRVDDYLQMDFPAQPPTQCAVPPQIVEAFDSVPIACLRHDDLIVVFAAEASIREANPDMRLLAQVECRGIIITARAADYDFVVRWFGPRVGIEEDPVTGSAYTQLAPYWAQQLNQTRFKARQVSKRGGDVICELRGDRVMIAGKAVKFMQATIEI